MVANNKIRILLVDDHGIMRDGLKVLLEKDENMEVIGEADTGQVAIEMCSKMKPDVVIMDVKMPGMDGIEAARYITYNCPDVKILTLATDLTDYTIRKAINIGVLGLMLKDSVFDELQTGIRTIYRNERYLCSQITKVVTSSYVKWLKTGTKPDTPDLTDEEYELIELLMKGKSVGEIALYLNRSPKTIDARRRKTMNKLGVSNMVELTKYAIRKGMTTVES